MKQIPRNIRKLIQLLSKRIEQTRLITDKYLCHALGTDASVYQLTPRLIVKISSLDELIFLVKNCAKLQVPYTFRAAGTSLSGQAISDSVLVMLTDDWRKHQILEQGRLIQLQPGIIGADANRYLSPYQRKIGPDPASIDSCKIGGIAANNASGMCCGTTHNAYQTLHSMKLVLADGAFLDTGDSENVAAFRKSHQQLLDQLHSLARECQQSDQLKALISKKYRLKNTTGYGLNALIDFTDPVDILQHLMIGSEGTLGFIAEVTLKTVLHNPHKATALLVYADIDTACQVTNSLARTSVSAVELMDGKALLSIADKAGSPDFIGQLDESNAALLIECEATTEKALLAECNSISKAIGDFKTIESVQFTQAPEISDNLWKVRKGLFPAVGARRKKGTSVIIEDVAFPLQHLASATGELQQLLQQHGYHEAVIFGHALEGNLHFVFTQDFSQPEEVQRYQVFMQQLSNLVAIKYQGSLKAEHGTGRNMAPFVKLEWGESAYELMCQIKQLFDPESLLNPGVLINSADNAHVTHLKTLNPASDMIDHCVECGFCESVCPSRNLSLTPRQRIVMYRQLKEFESNGDKQAVAELTRLFEYQGIETCAATGLCGDTCPVGINTGELVKQWRATHQKNSTIANWTAGWTANHFSTTSSLLKTTFKANRIIQSFVPDKVVDLLGGSLHQLTLKKIPLWMSEYPTANNNNRLAKLKSDNKVVYFPSCASRTMGTQPKAKDQRSLHDVIIGLLEKAGFEVIIPSQIEQSCCGMPYDSKGLDEMGQQKFSSLEKQLWLASEEGKIPVLMDTSPCARRSVINQSKPLKIFEPTDFAIDYLLDKLTVKPLKETIMLHITCSSRRSGLTDSLIRLARCCAEKVIIPEGIECCGWAGDKGFTVPELNGSALQSLRQQIPDGCVRGYSNSLSCEIGLSHHGKIPYQSILYLLDEVSQPLVVSVDGL